MKASAVRIFEPRALGKADYAIFLGDKNLVAVYDIETHQLDSILLAVELAAEATKKDLAIGTV